MEEIQRCKNDLCRRVREDYQWESWSDGYCCRECIIDGTRFIKLVNTKNNVKRVTVQPEKQTIFPHRLFKHLQLIIE